MSFIASKTYILTNGVDYAPGAAGGPIGVDDSWVMNIHILGTLTGNCTITTHAGSTRIFPVGALQSGAIYPYSVKTITLVSGDAGKVLGLSPGYKVVLF